MKAIITGMLAAVLSVSTLAAQSAPPKPQPKKPNPIPIDPIPPKDPKLVGFRMAI